MFDWVTEHEMALRLGMFFGIFFIMALFEGVAPRRPLTAPKWFRWLNNLTLVGLNAFVVRLVFPTALAGVAMFLADNRVGGFNVLDAPLWLSVPLSLIILDGVIWLQHKTFHEVPILWRLHRVHHADPDIDVTTGSRFHPLEILISMVIKVVAVTALGAPAVAVVLFEIMLNALAMFNHSNVRLPSAVDRIVRFLVVTPDMHRIHHSVIPAEYNTNYGFNLALWDRWFGTYTEKPRHGHLGMEIGLKGCQPAQATNVASMLKMPFSTQTH